MVIAYRVVLILEWVDPIYFISIIWLFPTLIYERGLDLLLIQCILPKSSQVQMNDSPFLLPKKNWSFRTVLLESTDHIRLIFFIFLALVRTCGKRLPVSAKISPSPRWLKSTTGRNLWKQFNSSLTVPTLWRTTARVLLAFPFSM